MKKNRKSKLKVHTNEPKKFPGFSTVLELFPAKFPGHRLNVDNTLGGLRPANSIILERGTFFHKTAWVCKPGWVLRGWATPPFPRVDAVAIVFEKLTPAGTSEDYWDRREPGVYWIHGYTHERFSDV